MGSLQVIYGYLELGRFLAVVMPGGLNRIPTQPDNPFLLLMPTCAIDVANPQERIYVHVVVCKGDFLIVRSEGERHDECGFETQSKSILNIVEIAYVPRSTHITHGFVV